MCGIVAYVGARDSVPVLFEGLRRMEYRGYDSAGVAIAGPSGLRVHKAAGRVRDLEASAPKRLKGAPGIGHTRWATHGAPTDANAHPHLDASGRVAVVHNGIVENASTLRAKLEAQGVTFTSETDTEIFAHLVAAELDSGAADLSSAVRQALSHIEGAYGIAVLDARHPEAVVVARNGSPVVLGIGEREMFAASDVAALVRHTRQVVHLDDGEIATVRADGFTTATIRDARPTDKQATEVTWDVEQYDRGGYEHFFRKEIGEQPEVLERVLRGRLDDRFATVHLGGVDLDARAMRDVRRVKVLGCGSALYSGQIGAQMIEDLARLPADSEAASEFRYRSPVIERDTLYVAVSQSGETYDTLAAVAELKRKGARVLGVVNVVGSSVARECDEGIYLHAGPEVSVASTKTFTATCVVLGLLALHLGRVRDLSISDGRRVVEGLRALPGQVAEVLATEDEIAALAPRVAKASSVMFVGRVAGYAAAREGAQKLKEVSYVHAEAYPGAELKHGPLALISPSVPTVALVPDDDMLDKNVATLSEIKARGGPVIAVSHERVDLPGADAVIRVPRSEPEFDPVLMTVALQLLAYHAAVHLGRDVDKPRNLAKSVTVE